MGKNQTSKHDSKAMHKRINQINLRETERRRAQGVKINMPTISASVLKSKACRERSQTQSSKHSSTNIMPPLSSESGNHVQQHAPLYSINENQVSGLVGGESNYMSTLSVNSSTSKAIPFEKEKALKVKNGTRISSAYSTSPPSKKSCIRPIVSGVESREFPYSEDVQIMPEEMRDSAFQWLQAQRLRNNNKRRNVDTRASKGRKTRYISIDKLVNFFPSAPELVPWSHEKRNELFKSVFI